MINLNTKKYGKANIHFKVKDIILDEYPIKYRFDYL